VEVDCTGVFRPGQIAVAIGRVRTTEGMRILNFSPDLCIPPPASVPGFEQQPSLPPADDLSCCILTR